MFMEVSLFGAAKTVTGSCYSISTKREKILIDCGMFQGNKDMERLNYQEFGFNPKEYNSLILTHSHLDHCGRLPRLIMAGFKGKIFATSATKDLAFVILMDAAKIASHDVQKENERRKQQGLPARFPIYTEDDVKKTMSLFETKEYGREFKVTDNIFARFYDAGHIVGAASVQLRVIEGKKSTVLAFSGDIGPEGTPIVKDLEMIGEADYVFVESTYGDRLHPPISERKNEFLNVIINSYEKGGKLLIPSFAIERAQELLYDMNEFAEKGIMPKMNVYLDSPMAIKATEVFKAHEECYNDEIKQVIANGDNPFHFPGLIYSETVDDSRNIGNDKKPFVVIAGSGMCTAGRIKMHIKNYISDPNSTILFVGFQVEGTLGYWIKKGEKKVRLLGSEVDVNAEVKSIDSFSGHADYKGLLNWLKYFSPKPKKVFICHGEEKTIIKFSKRVKKLSLKAYIPTMGEKIVL